MYNQPLICIAAANRIVSKLIEHYPTTRCIVIDGEENELAKINALLYVCKMLWLSQHDTCEMIPENFVTSFYGPRVPGLSKIYPGYKWELRKPKYYMESRQLTEEEKALIDKVVYVSTLWTPYALHEYIERIDVLYKNAQRQGLHVITTNMMALHLKNAHNKNVLRNFALWGYREKKEGYMPWEKQATTYLANSLEDKNPKRNHTKKR